MQITSIHHYRRLRFLVIEKAGAILLMLAMVLPVSAGLHAIPQTRHDGSELQSGPVDDDSTGALKDMSSPINASSVHATAERAERGHYYGEGAPTIYGVGTRPLATADVEMSAILEGIYTNVWLGVTGGVAPYTLSIDGDLPDGMWYDDDEGACQEESCLALYGTPDQGVAGTYTFAVHVTDNGGDAIEREFTLLVEENPNRKPVFEGFSPDTPSLTVRVGDTVRIEAIVDDEDGDDLIYEWRLDWNYLGETNENAFVWQPAADDLGNHILSVLYSDEYWYHALSMSYGNGFIGEEWAPSISVVAADAPMIDTDLPHATEGIDYAVQLTATGGTAPYTWSMEENYNASISDSGILELRTSEWYFDDDCIIERLDITVTDAEGRSTTQRLSIVVEANPNKKPIIDDWAPYWDQPDFDITTPVGEEIVFSVEAHDPEGELLTFIWSLDNEPMEETGNTLSWTPGRADIGDHELHVVCTDGERDSWELPWYFKVVTTNVLSADLALPAAVVGETYSASFSVSGGTEPYAWGTSEYAMTREQNSFADTGVAQDWAEDDGCWSVALPFSFPFYGSTYDEIWISDNGTICLDGEFSESYFQEGVFNSHALIAPLWKDFDGRLQTVSIDESVSGQLTVVWQTHYWGDDNGPIVSFAATLCEDGEIRLSFGDEAPNGAVGISAGDGIRFELPAGLQNSTLSSDADVVFRPATMVPGLAFSSNGTISGVPATAGTYRFPVAVIDDEGAIWSGTAMLVVLSDAHAEIIPAIADGADGEAVTNAIESAGFVDAAAVMAAIGGDAAKYIAFKRWADAVKDGYGNLAGEAAVVASPHAAVSWLLGADALFESEPEIRIASLALADAQGTACAMTVTVEVKDGEDIVKVAEEKVASMFEATSDLRDWNGTGKLTPAVSGAARNADNTMTFTVTPGDGTATSAFLRIKVK